jgi:hypothetical protein
MAWPRRDADQRSDPRRRADRGLGSLDAAQQIAQRFRGAVATTGGTGYTKNYGYDDRLKYRSPPFFLDPVQASWKIHRSNEQVPAVAERAH